MKAVAYDTFGGPEKLHLIDLPIPSPSENEVQILVHYCGVNPVDWKIREGMLKTRLPSEFPIISGWDAAGTISAIGSNVKDFKVGDEVYAFCRKPIVKWGTYAEYVTVEDHHIALKPKNISFAQASSIPLVGLTSLQVLFDVAQLKKGETLFIPAGAGGVGSIAIQLAHLTGAKVFTTASNINHPYVKKLGAYMAIEYRYENFVEKIRMLEPEGVDVVFDTMGGDTLRQSFEVLKKGGRIVSIVEKPDAQLAEQCGVKPGYVFVRPSGSQLKELTKLLEEGKIFSPNIEEMDLTDAAAAQEKVEGGHTRGKIVLKVK